MNRRVSYKRGIYLVCKLNKTLYGLKESPRAWYHCINSFFINEVFCKSQADKPLYVNQTDEYLLVTILYVNFFYHIGTQCNPIEVAQVGA